MSEQDGSSVVPKEVLARGAPFLDGNKTFVDDLRAAVEDTLDEARRSTGIEVVESMLHDDLAACIYDKLTRRPMVLPVVVEVWLCLPAALRAQSGATSLDLHTGSGGLGSCESCGDAPSRVETGGPSR